MMAVAAPPAAAPSGPNLRDIHLPPEPSWWPPAPGWWLLAVLSLALLLLGVWWWKRRRRVLRHRQEVLSELDRLVLRHRQDGDHAMLASGMHQLLRRVARRHVAQAAHQRGEAWRRTLARVPVDAPTLQRLMALDQLIYRPLAAFDDADAVAAAARHWLRLALKPASWKPAITERTDA